MASSAIVVNKSSNSAGVSGGRILPFRVLEFGFPIEQISCGEKRGQPVYRLGQILDRQMGVQVGHNVGTVSGELLGDRLAASCRFEQAYKRMAQTVEAHAGGFSFPGATFLPFNF